MTLLLDLLADEQGKELKVSAGYREKVTLTAKTLEPTFKAEIVPGDKTTSVEIYREDDSLACSLEIDTNNFKTDISEAEKTRDIASLLYCGCQLSEQDKITVSDIQDLEKRGIVISDKSKKQQVGIFFSGQNILFYIKDERRNLTISGKISQASAELASLLEYPSKPSDLNNHFQVIFGDDIATELRVGYRVTELKTLETGCEAFQLWAYGDRRMLSRTNWPNN